MEHSDPVNYVDPSGMKPARTVADSTTKTAIEAARQAAVAGMPIFVVQQIATGQTKPNYGYDVVYGSAAFGNQSSYGSNANFSASVHYGRAEAKNELYNYVRETFVGHTTDWRNGKPSVYINGKWVAITSYASAEKTFKCLDENMSGYWNNSSGYFEGQWWTDKQKRKEAFEMLRLEASSGFDPFDTSLSRSKTQALQVLATSNISLAGTADNNLVERITDILHLRGMDYEGGELGAKEIEALIANENGISDGTRNANYWMNSGWSDVMTGAAIIAGGIAGNYVEGASGAKINGVGNSVKSNTGKVIDTTPSTNHTMVTKNPGLKGEANSSIDIMGKNGELSTRRWFDQNGNQIRNVDMTNHGNPGKHPEVPHEHGTR
ncbi:MAG: hypothetical protein RR588_09605 [Solibacillus sp.]